MAARRLIMVMLGLLGLSILISFFVPNRADRKEDGATGPSAVTSTTGPTGTSAAQGATGPTGTRGTDGPERQQSMNGKTLTATVRVAAAKPNTPSYICARPGQRVVLTLVTGEALDVAIPDLGLTSSSTKYAPAVFDLLLPDEEISFEVTALESGRRLASITTGPVCPD